MQTTCPECRTTFRITQAHLGLRRGLVRCGRCNAVFNAYDTLLPELEEPPPPVQALAEPREPAPGAEPPPEPVLEFQAPAPAAPPPEFEPAAEFGPAAPEAEPAPPTEPEPAPPAASPEVLATPAPLAQPLPGVETAESILLAELPTRRHAGQARLPLWQGALLGLLALLLLLGLLAQVVYFFRADLAAALPASRPTLTRLCQPFGCDVPLPRQLTRQAITASALEHDPEQKSRVRLTFLLSNRTGRVQAWPHLALTLSDVRDAPVAHKLFPPASYLPKGTRLDAGMAAASEQEIRLDLDVGNLAPSGYALGLVYP